MKAKCWAFLGVVFFLPVCGAAADRATIAARESRLLRNGNFQDDFLTLLPELKNHHWNYTQEVFNRRDYVPDGWLCSGQWRWEGADRPRGERRLILHGPARVVQCVNWATVNNPARLEGWPDAGGYPAAEFPRATQHGGLVRDVTLRLLVSGNGVPAEAGQIVVAYCGASPIDDPLGSKRTVFAQAAIPAGTYADCELTVTLPAATWLATAQKDPTFAQGAILPGSVACEIQYAGKSGTLELHHAGLTAASPPAAPFFLADFEDPLDGATGGDATTPRLRGPLATEHRGFPSDRPAATPGNQPFLIRKYRYFPPGLYYIFNTWHHANAMPRGAVEYDPLISRSGRSLQMTLATGDETCVQLPLVTLPKPHRFVEVSAWIKTESVAMYQIEAVDAAGNRIPGFNTIHKMPLSIGSDDWREVRQVLHLPAGIAAFSLRLCGRGSNGYTLDDTGLMPQNNFVGTLWWDDVSVYALDAVAGGGAAAGGNPLKPLGNKPVAGPRLSQVDFGDRLRGANRLTARVHGEAAPASYQLTFEVDTPGGKRHSFVSAAVSASASQPADVAIAYQLHEDCPAYREYRGRVTLKKVGAAAGAAHPSSHVWFATWPTPIDLELGALYLRPAQKQFVRANFGLASDTLAQAVSLRLDVVRRGSQQVGHSMTVPATPQAIVARRNAIPTGLREDFRNLVLADMDVSRLEVQPFSTPERNWIVRATLLDAQQKTLATVDSPPFCRLAHDGPQAAVQTSAVGENGLVLVNGKPWMPWGVTYGHNPVFDGPADGPGPFQAIGELKPWSLYDRHGGNLSDRTQWDGSCLRYVEGPVVKPEALELPWKTATNYASTIFVKPPFDAKNQGLIQFLKTAPMVVSVSPGPEETFGYFYPMSAAGLKQAEAEAQQLRQATGKPVLVGHGGYWNRLEFERVPFFDIYDPETEPLYPAPIHTDLAPLLESNRAAGKKQAIWVRPQMYEDVPYERWRYHVYVELMRGARGWQLAHGPGDASTFRGLHGELKQLLPALASTEKPPAISATPALEHRAWRHAGKTYLVAATTHGMRFGTWSDTYLAESNYPVATTQQPHAWSDESNGYNAATGPGEAPLAVLGAQYFSHARSWPAGTRIATRLSYAKPPQGLMLLAKVDGRWTSGAGWGKTALPWANNADRLHWFLRTFYRHSSGFMGWGREHLEACRPLVPTAWSEQGKLPAAGGTHALEIALENLGPTSGAAVNKRLDGIAFLHTDGAITWGETRLVAPDRSELPIAWSDRLDQQADGDVTFTVAGLKKGTKVRVLWENRELVAGDGLFVDDFRGQDLYQHFGGRGSGYGRMPVAVHVYEIATP